MSCTVLQPNSAMVAAAAMKSRLMSSVLEWLCFQLYFAVDDVDAKGDGVDVVALAHDLRLLLDHLAQLFHRQVRELSELQVFLLDLRIELLDLLPVRAGHHLYIRIGRG